MPTPGSLAGPGAPQQRRTRPRLRGWHLRFLGLGATGQALTLTSMLVPILLRRADQVFVLVFTSAIAHLLLNFAVLAFPFLFPVLRGPRLARVATVWSSISLGVVSAAVVGLTPLEQHWRLPGGTFLACGILTGTLGLYAIVLTRLVRAEDTTGIGLTRFCYGVLVLAATLVASATALGPLALTYATALAFLLTALILAFRRTHWGPALPRPDAAARRRLRRAYLGRTIRPAMAGLAGGWASLVPGLVLPGLGAAAEPWAVITRICGGFATVMITLVAPPLESRLSRAVRARDAADFTAGRRTALLLGLGFAAVAVPSALGLAVYISDDVDPWLAPVAVAALLFWVPLLAGNLVNRLPNFLGRDTARLLWDTGRAVLLTVAFLTTEGVAQLIVMGVVLSATGLLLLPLTRWRPTRRVSSGRECSSTA